MPQIINSGGSRSEKPKSKSGKSSGGSAINTSADISELPKPMLIGIGVVLLVFLVFMVDRFVVRSHPTAQGYVKVAPPPGYPDVAPYNSKAWQDSGRRQLSGMPPPQVLKQWADQGKASQGKP